MNYDKENKTLGHLIDINQDACDFYKSASERVRNPRLERSFADLQRLHSAVVMDLTQRIRENGGQRQSERHGFGHRLWQAGHAQCDDEWLREGELAISQRMTVSFLTDFTPFTPRAISTAFWADSRESTKPLSCTVPLNVST